VTRKIDVLAKEMNIDRKSFCWAASMHYAKNHPHVHIMYWDNSGKVRREHVPKERFELMAEHVRSAFGREIYREELAEYRAESKEISDRARLQLQAVCREANLSEALSLERVSSARLDALGKQLAALALDLPDRGSLKYAYLPAGYKAKVNAFIDEVMKLPDFSRLQTRYLNLTDQISALYGNGAERAAFNREGAKGKLYTDLGNSVMGVLKEYQAELTSALPPKAMALRAVVGPAVRRVAQLKPQYLALSRLMPRERTPTRVIMANDKFRETKDKLVKEVCRDARIRALLRGYVKTNWAGEGAGRGKKQQFEADARRDLYRAADDIIQGQLRKDAGYEAQHQAWMACKLLLSMFKSGSQGANQARSQRDLLRRRPARELSETARMDRKKRRELEGNWERE
jgi:hypothetical protein